MRNAPRALFAIGALLAASACEPPTSETPDSDPPEWATLPPVEDLEYECPEEPAPPLSLCNWAWSAEALVVARVRSVSVDWAPAYRKAGSDTYAEADPESCDVLDPAVVLEVETVTRLGGPRSGDVERVRFGGARTEAWFHATTYPSVELSFEDEVERFEEGSKVILPVYEAPSGELTVVDHVLPRVVEGRLVLERAEAACTGGDVEADGMRVDDVLAVAATCEDTERARELRALGETRASFPGDGTSVVDSALCRAR